MVKFLVEEVQASVHFVDDLKRTPLHDAAMNGQARVADVLMVRGAEVNAREVDQWTPLHCAALCGHVGVAEVLLTFGAHVDALDRVSCPRFSSVFTHHVFLFFLLSMRSAVCSIVLWFVLCVVVSGVCVWLWVIGCVGVVLCVFV